MPEETLNLSFTVDDSAMFRLRNKFGTGSGNTGAFVGRAETMLLFEARLDEFARELEQALKDEFATHNQTGYTVGTFHVEGHGLSLRVVMGGGAIYVEYGTAPHVIESSTGGALYWDDADHPVKEVHHPGYIGDDFVSRAMERVDAKTWMRKFAYSLVAEMKGGATSAISGEFYDLNAPGARMGGLLE